MIKRKPIAAAVAAAIGASSFSVLGGTALAQDAPEADDDDTIEEIITTGSRIVTQDGFGRTSPVTVMGSEDIASLGMTRPEDLLNSLPQVETALHSFDANGISGTASIDLRGLGAFRTLVLMNGRRMQPGGVQATAVDVNQIPAAMIERVEVLTGGASATYGADAVAGVVNFILRRMDGVELSIGASGYQHDNSNSYVPPLLDARGFDYPTGDSGIGGETYNIDLVVGSDFADGRGNATAYATWRKNEEMLQAERDYGSCALNNAATSCGGSANAIVPNFFIAPASDGYSDYARSLFLSMQTGGTLEPYDGTNTYNYAPVNHFMRPDERYAFGTIIDYELSERATVYFEANYANDVTRGQIAESGTFFAEEYYLPLDNSVFPQLFQDELIRWFDNQYCHETWTGVDANDGVTPISNPNVCVDITSSPTENGDGDPSTFLFQMDGYGGNLYIQDEDDPATTTIDERTGGQFVPFDEYGIYIGKRNVEGGPRASNFQHDAFRAVAGIKGALTDTWDYDASFLYGETSSSMAYVNDFFAPNIRVAIDGDACAATSGCIPYEVFTYQGVTSAAAVNMLGTAIMMGKTSTEVINAYVSGDTGWTFPGADNSVQVVAGFEHRTEQYERISDSVFQQGSLLGQGGPTPGVAGGYTVTEFFAEGNVPVLETLSLDLAYRYSDYSTSGGTDTYRVGFDFQPIDQVRLRAGLNRAVRAPNVAELFSVQSLGLWSGDDPCAGDTPAYTEAQCANLGVTSAQYGNVNESPAGQYNGLFGGNPNLAPEEADTITLGVVVDPIDNLTISVDYWNIEITDTINNIGATTIIEQCGLYGVLCDQVIRNQSGNLWQGTQGYVIDTTINLGENVWEGIDLAANWEFYGLDGAFTVDLIGTYMQTKETTPLPADANSTYDCVGLASTRCFPTPDWRHTASVTYDSNEWWSVEARWRYFGGVDYDGTADTIAQDELSSAQNYFDLNAAFTFMDNYDVTIGINNVLDEEPPMVGGTLTTNANTYAGFYDTLGRFLYMKATARF